MVMEATVAAAKAGAAREAVKAEEATEAGGLVAAATAVAATVRRRSRGRPETDATRRTSALKLI
jgi:hypothetical protein